MAFFHEHHFGGVYDGLLPELVMEQGKGFIELANAKKASAQSRLSALEIEAEKLKKEIVEWDVFIEKAVLLTGDSVPKVTDEVVPIEVGEYTTPSTNGSHKKAITLRKGSWAAEVAKVIQKDGPQTMRMLKRVLAAKAAGRTKNFQQVLFLALKRRNDLFRKSGGPRGPYSLTGPFEISE